MAGLAFAVARVRALENKLLDRGQWERLIGAASPEEVWRILGETVYARWMDGRSYHQYEDVFWDELAETADFLRSVVKKDSFVEDYLFKYELHNLKVFFLQKLTGKKGRFLPISLYGEKEETVLEHPRLYNGGLLTRMAAALQKTSFAGAQDLQRTVDNEYYRYMAEKKSEFSPILQRFWSDFIDLTNLRILLRVKVMGEGEEYLRSFLLPGGNVKPGEFLPALTWSAEEIKSWWIWKPTGRVFKELDSIQPLWKVQKEIYKYLSENLEKTHRLAFGEEPLFAYLWDKENEIRRLRILLAAKINRLPEEEWKGRI